MKVIELISKLKNGEEVPKTIEYDNTIWNLCTNVNGYKDYYSDEALIDSYLRNCELYRFINDEIELIEEEKKKIELPGELKEILIPSSLSDSDDFRFIFNYINDLIKNQKQTVDYIKYKEEEKEK